MHIFAMATARIPLDVVYFDEPPAHKAEDYLKAYRGHVYSAVSLISQIASTIDIKLYRRLADEGVEEVDTHPAIDALWYTNEWMTWQQLREVHHTYFELVGEAVWLLLRANGVISEIIPLRPDWVSLMPDGKGGIKYYEYNIGGKGKTVKLNPDDVLFDKDHDPTNLYRGLGKVKPASMPIDIDDYSNTWNRNFFFNSAMPSMILSTESQLTPEGKRRFVRKFQATHGGVRNAHKVAFMDGGALKVDQISTSMQELDFQQSKNRLMEEILSIFHMSKSNLGITDDVNLANAEVQERRLMKMVIKPRLIHFVGFLNEFYLPKFNVQEDIFFNFEDPVSEDMTAKVALLTAASNGGWMTKNEIREQLGYDPLDAGGDDIYQPMSLQPLGIDPTTPEPRQPAGDEQDDEKPQRTTRHGVYKTFVPRRSVRSRLAAPIPPKNSKRVALEVMRKEITHDIKALIIDLMKNGHTTNGEVESVMSKEDKDAYWKAFVAKALISERVLAKALIELATDQQQLVIDKLNKHKRSLGAKNTLQPTTFVFSIKDETKRYKQVIRPILAKLIRHTGNEELRKLPVARDMSGVVKQLDLDMSSAAVVEFLESLGISFATEIVNETTRAELIATLDEGLKQGESYDELKKRVEAVYDAYKGYRASTIARTETLRSLNFATLEAYKQSGVVIAKEWLTALDEKVRIAHESVNGKVVPINKPFMVDGEPMMQPHDPGASASNTVNCRCTLLPVLEAQYLAMREISEKKKAVQIDSLLTEVAKKLTVQRLYRAARTVAKQKEVSRHLDTQVAKKQKEVARLTRTAQQARHAELIAKNEHQRARKKRAAVRKETKRQVQLSQVITDEHKEMQEKAKKEVVLEKEKADEIKREVKKELGQLQKSVVNALGVTK